MEISPATGKILGMVMAYGVSSLGLLLAYYHYRKRIVRAKKIFTPLATAITALVSLLGVAVVVFVVIAMVQGGGEEEPTQAAPEPAEPATPAQTATSGAEIFGYVVPPAIFLFSFWMTWMLYKHFAKKMRTAQPASARTDEG